MVWLGCVRLSYLLFNLFKVLLKQLTTNPVSWEYWAPNESGCEARNQGERGIGWDVVFSNGVKLELKRWDNTTQNCRSGASSYALGQPS